MLDRPEQDVADEARRIASRMIIHALQGQDRIEQRCHIEQHGGSDWLEAHLPEIGALALRDKPAVRADLGRICSLWSGLLQEHGGPMLFGQFSVADAYFAPVVMRLKTYALPVPADVQAYMDRVCALPGVKAWIDDALAEQDFIDFEEPFRLSR